MCPPVPRLDMENMILSQPTPTDQKCESDQFIVTGGAPIPAICGVNTGAHSKNIFLNLWLQIE